MSRLIYIYISRDRERERERARERDCHTRRTDALEREAKISMSFPAAPTTPPENNESP